MKLTELRLGQRVIHPQYGEGEVRAINEFAAEILFREGRKPVDPEAASLAPCQESAAPTTPGVSMETWIAQVVEATVERLGIERSSSAVHELAGRWRGGTLILRPADPQVQSKEVELDVFFGKIVMMRNQLCVLEQKINGSEVLSSADKFDWQQYLTRCYGSMTTFNLLFKDKESGF